MYALGVGPKEEPHPRTRCGYLPSECIRSFERALNQGGPVATGRALHFAADIVCSGGIDALLRSLWEYSVCHVGIGSPRVFVYLKKRSGELLDMLRRLPDEQAYKAEEFQIRVGELVLVLRDAPIRTTVPWPKVGPETHTAAWIRGVAGGAADTAAVRKVWRPEGDEPILRTVGAELCKAITEGATERALFWIKWLFEEEARIKKEVKGAVLTTIDRGSGFGGSAKSKSGAGHFVLALYAEIYKELAGKQAIRMTEEFQVLLDLWRGGDKKVQGAAKKGVLALLTQILCEVPRWKVPAAPALIKDPVATTQAIRQVPKFFAEVLAFDPPGAGAAVVKAFRTRGKVDAKAVAAAKKGEAQEDQMSAFDKALEAYFAKM
jgi:hypothetical protein